MFPQTLKLLMEISSAWGNGKGAQGDQGRRQMSKFPHKEAESLFHLSNLFAKKVYSVII